MSDAQYDLAFPMFNSVNVGQGFRLSQLVPGLEDWWDAHWFVTGKNWWIKIDPEEVDGKSFNAQNGNDVSQKIFVDDNVRVRQ